MQDSNSINYEKIAFTKVRLPFGWLGNMAPYPVTYESKDYRTTEALFQALRFSAHPEIQEEIRSETSPMSAKMTAKKYKHILATDGYIELGQQDIDYMVLCLKLKLEQHPHLQEELINTDQREIIEDCTSRPHGSGVFWGAAKQDGVWVGENILGKLWMKERRVLQNNLTNQNKM